MSNKYADYANLTEPRGYFVEIMIVTLTVMILAGLALFVASEGLLI